MKIYFLRHTEADDDRRDSYGGIANDPLIQSGREYAEKVGKLLSEKGIEVLYTSPYARAKETALLINENIGVEVAEIYNLRERNSYGVVSGIEKKIVEKLFPEIDKRIKQMKKEGTKPSKSVETLPGAEIYLNLLLRAKDAFKQIFRESQLKGFNTVALVTHGGFAYAFFKDVINTPLDLEKGEIVVIEGKDLESLEINQTETNELKQ